MIEASKISEIIDKITSEYKPAKIVLFGSYAKGSARTDSDLDFIIVKNTDTPKTKRSAELRMLLLGSLVPLDLKIYTPAEFDAESSDRFSFLHNALKGSKVVYER